jgi:hypothetical protein
VKFLDCSFDVEASEPMKLESDLATEEALLLQAGILAVCGREVQLEHDEPYVSKHA